MLYNVGIHVVYVIYVNNVQEVLLALLQVLDQHRKVKRTTSCSYMYMGPWEFWFLHFTILQILQNKSLWFLGCLDTFHLGIT